MSHDLMRDALYWMARSGCRFPVPVARWLLGATFRKPAPRPPNPDDEQGADTPLEAPEQPQDAP
jgi:hypothetical protein